MISLYLSLYISVISILLDAIASRRLGEEPNLNSPSNYEISQFRLWVPLKVVLTHLTFFDWLNVG